MAFFRPEDIANRAAQILGVPHIISLFPPDQSITAHEINDCYERLRDAELARNLWTFATRRVALRALDTTSSLVNFETWSSTYTYIDGTSGYPLGYVVKDTSGNVWVSLANQNRSTPGTFGTAGAALTWDAYFGDQTANVWNDNIQNTDPNNITQYHAGEIVYMFATGNIYVSLLEGNQNEPDVVDAFSLQTMYSSGAVVSSGGVNYQSVANLNFGNTPPNATYWTTVITNPLVSNTWKQLTGATLSTVPIVYPITAGPARDPSTANCFRKPRNWLRAAPQAPTAGIGGWLGAHVGLPQSDMVAEGGFLVSKTSDTALLYRFVARIVDVTQMDDMFCNGLASRIAWDICKSVVQDPKLWASSRQDAQRAYDKVMSEARIVNAIEAGPIVDDEDEYITCRY